MPRWFIPFSISAALAACPAWAGSFVYASLASWTASSPGSTAVLDFESYSPAYYGSFSYSPYAFTASGGLYILGGAAAGTGSGHYLTTTGDSTLNIALAAGVYGVAFNLGSNSGAAAAASIVGTDANGVQYSTSGFTTSGPPGPAMFWGLRNDVQLVNVKITFTSGIQPQVDNVRYSNTALPAQGPATPEPETWALVATGIAALFFRRKLLPRDSQDLRTQLDERALQLAGVG